MVLNYIWIAFFLIAFIVALLKLLFFGDTEIFRLLVDSTFSSSKSAFEISIGLTGMMTLWMGMLNIGEKAGVVNFFSKLVSPLFNRLFPEIPRDHPAMGEIVMNFSANMLGLGNAATPLGLKAMQSMQELNHEKEKASNSQIMFLVLNTAGFTLLPVTIMMLRVQQGAGNPSDVFIPILLASFFATSAGVTMVALRQGIKILDPVLLAWALGIGTLLFGLVLYFHSLTHQRLAAVSMVSGNFILFGIIICFLTVALFKKVNVFDSFIQGAKNGFETAVKLIPYLVAFFVGIAVFRVSGAMEILLKGIGYMFSQAGISSEIVKALPTALLKPLSGSGASSMTLNIMQTYGVDSFASRLACVFQGSADTTFYIVALYFGSVGIKNTRYAIPYGLLTDISGFIAAIFVAYLFFK
jgi:spore maturation protein SpmA